VSISCSFVRLYLQFCDSLDDISHFVLTVYVTAAIYLYNVCTISAVLYLFAPYVEVEYFDDRGPFPADFSSRMRRNGIISTSGLKSVVIVVFSDIDFL